MNEKTQNTKRAANSIDNFIVFRLEKELYATPLLSVKEIVEIQLIKPVPYTPSYYLGIMNLRGEVISVIDLKKKFGTNPLNSHTTQK